MDKKLLLKIRKKKEEKKKILEEKEFYNKITIDKIENQIKYIENLTEDK